jgi:hypothetical protein
MNLSIKLFDDIVSNRQRACKTWRDNVENMKLIISELHNEIIMHFHSLFIDQLGSNSWLIEVIEVLLVHLMDL